MKVRTELTYHIPYRLRELSHEPRERFLRSSRPKLAGFERKKRIAATPSFHYFRHGGQSNGNSSDATIYNSAISEQSAPSGGSAMAGSADARPGRRWGVRVRRTLDRNLLPAVVPIAQTATRASCIFPAARGCRAKGLPAVLALPASDDQSARSSGRSGGARLPRD